MTEDLLAQGFAAQAAPEAILGQFLIGFGNSVGRGPFKKRASTHHLNEFGVLVGETSFGRKGTVDSSKRLDHFAAKLFVCFPGIYLLAKREAFQPANILRESTESV